MLRWHHEKQQTPSHTCAHRYGYRWQQDAAAAEGRATVTISTPHSKEWKVRGPVPTQDQSSIRQQVEGHSQWLLRFQQWLPSVGTCTSVLLLLSPLLSVLALHVHVLWHLPTADDGSVSTCFRSHSYMYVYSMNFTRVAGCASQVRYSQAVRQFPGEGQLDRGCSPRFLYGGVGRIGEGRRGRRSHSDLWNCYIYKC